MLLVSSTVTALPDYRETYKTDETYNSGEMINNKM